MNHLKIYKISVSDFCYLNCCRGNTIYTWATQVSSNDIQLQYFLSVVKTFKSKSECCAFFNVKTFPQNYYFLPWETKN
jgi:hypothetical protein